MRSCITHPVLPVRPHTAVILLVSLCALLAPPLSGWAAAQEVEPMHAVVCEGTAEIPYRSGSKIWGYGAVKCNAPPDIFYMEVQLQRLESGVWKNYGAPATYNTPTTYKRLGDWVYCPGTGYHSYRTKLHFEGFHGTWDVTTKYSNSFRTNC